MNDQIGMPPPSPAGWYPSTTHPGRLEYWDGARWTGQLAPSPAPPRPASGGGWAKLGTWTKVGLVTTAAVLLLFMITSGAAGFLAAAGAIALFTAGYVLVTGRRSWAMIASRKVGAFLLVGAVVALAVSGSLAPKKTETAALQFSSESTAEDAAPAPSPTREPVVTTANVVVTEAVPFTATTVDDPALAAGTVQVTIAGVAGIRTITYRVTTTDGRETKRTVVSDVITTPPVAQVTSNGTYVEPPAAPVPFADAGSGCDGNYSGACVPIASDVDCAGGSGNGPAYVSGPVYVVGSDVYDLDRDGDGIACDA